MGKELSSCVSCHEDTLEEIQTSIHFQQGLSCHNCHGGNPKQNEQKLAKSRASGYIGVPDKKKAVEVCGQCHSDVEFMNSYKIRTDQLARYKTSTHGKRLYQEGNEDVATCTDCHGYHEIMQVKDPTSSVHPSNVPKTCNQCHGREKLMKKYDLPANIFNKYKDSVHGKALFDKQDTSVANCAKCHGSHGAVPPGVKEVSTVCGQCHINEEKYFQESIHAPLIKEGKFSGCISCHNNHDIEKTNISMYESICAKCHGEKSTAFEAGQKIMFILEESKTTLETTTAMVKQASIEGLFVEDELLALEKEKTNMISIAPAQHTLSFKKVSEIHQKIISSSEAIQKKIKKKRKSFMWRKLALIPLWIFIFIMVFALWTKFNRLKKEDKQK